MGKIRSATSGGDVGNADLFEIQAFICFFLKTPVAH